MNGPMPNLFGPMAGPIMPQMQIRPFVPYQLPPPPPPRELFGLGMRGGGGGGGLQGGAGTNQGPGHSGGIGTW